MCVNEEIYQDNPDCLIKRKSKKDERDKKKKSIEGGSVCVNEEIYQDNTCCHIKRKPTKDKR